MYKFASDVSKLVHDIGSLDTIAEKTASENASRESQAACCQAADALYGVMQKKAAEECNGDMCGLVTKMAQLLGKPTLTTEQYVKLAAAVEVDKVLCGPKTAEVRAFGREFFATLLREVL
jgi:hypothetical protein